MATADPGPFLYQAEAALEAGDRSAARALYEAIAEAGDARAWVHLGDLAAGDEATGPAGEAVELYRRGADAGDPLAAVRLADALAAAGDTDAALTWYDRAADHGVAAGAARAGSLLWHVDPDANAAAAEARWTRSVELGNDVDSLLGLAEVELSRNDPVAAVGFAIRASLAARHRLLDPDETAFAYDRVDLDAGTEEIAHGLERAMHLVNRYRTETMAAAESGDPEASWHWGRIEELGFGQLPDPEEGLVWIERAADAGHGEALLALARRDREAGDMAGAERRLRAAADAGIPAALHDLAFARYSGAFGGEPDVEAAIETYREAAGPSRPTTATDLSFVLEDRPGAEAAEESLRWLRVAADAGGAAALRRLGERSRDGEGVDADHRSALRCFMAAYYAGWTDGIESMRTVSSGLSADEIVATDRDVDGSGRAAALLLGLDDA